MPRRLDCSRVPPPPKFNPTLHSELLTIAPESRSGAGQTRGHGTESPRLRTCSIPLDRLVLADVDLSVLSSLENAGRPEGTFAWGIPSLLLTLSCP